MYRRFCVNFGSLDSRWFTPPALGFLGGLVWAGWQIGIHPKFFDPLWSFHSDWYIFVEWAQAANARLEALLGARPVSMALLIAFGWFGPAAFMAILWAIFLANLVIVGLGVRKAANLTAGPVYFAGFVAYCALVMGHPWQYVWAAYDATALLSFTLIGIGALCALHGAKLVWVVAFSFAGFLAKETFFISAFVVFLALALGRCDRYGWAVFATVMAAMGGVCYQCVARLAVLWLWCAGS